MKEHMEAEGSFQFMGSHRMTIETDVDWDENGNAVSIEGIGRMKMGKWFEYPFMTPSSATKNEDGSMHFEVPLKSMFGNGTLATVLDIDTDDNLAGQANILKGLALKFSAKVTHF